ncbi:hypothetical protein Tsp_00575 [Trichinella spiralis]|uniref:hypothetical protein n=1 Tax=Trichinella spiralis TaxID=6334 RepID=UPI0001EFBE5C|nr:hypothetical protein Tsp_00575 [Trichinella spiralis]
MARTTKEALRAMKQCDWEYNLANFLFCKRVTPCTTTGKSPAELLMNRSPWKPASAVSPTGPKTLRKRYITTNEYNSEQTIDSQKETTREKTGTAEVIPEGNAAVVTTPREESEAGTQSVDTTRVGQRRPSM